MVVKQLFDSETRKQPKEVSWRCSMTSMDITHMHIFISTSCRNNQKISINKGQLKCLILWRRWTDSLFMEIAPNVKQPKFKTLLALVLRSSRWEKTILYHPTLLLTTISWVTMWWISFDGRGMAQPLILLPKRAEGNFAPWQSGGWLPKGKGYAFCNANSCYQTATCYGRIKGLHKDFGFILVNGCSKYLWGEQSSVGDKLCF